MEWYLPIIISAVIFIFFCVIISLRYKRLFVTPIDGYFNRSQLTPVISLHVPSLEFQPYYRDIKGSAFFNFVLFSIASVIIILAHSDLPFYVFFAVVIIFTYPLMRRRISQFKNYVSYNDIFCMALDNPKNIKMIREVEGLTRKVYVSYLMLLWYKIFLVVFLFIITLLN